MTAWPRVKLADCVNLLSGFAFKSEHFTENDDDVPLVKGENVSQGRILWEISKRWPKGDWEKLEKFQLASGDVIIAMDRPWVPAGLKWAFIRAEDPKALLVQRCARLRTKTESFDQDFLRFVIGSPDFENYVRPITTGVNVPHISGQQILAFEFMLPPLPIQQHVATILSAYDELIENSQRRINILEEMARTLYREWFVHFRLPSHDNFPKIDSPIGNIPKGWEVKNLGSISDYINRGISPSYGEDGSSNVINQKCIRDQRVSLEPARKQSKSIPPEKLIRFGDVLINSTGVGTLGRVAQVYEDLDQYTVDSHVTIARAAEGVDVDYFGCALLARQEEFERLGVGATGQTELSRTAISNIEVCVPPTEVQQRFGRMVRPARLAATTLSNQIKNLRRTRDLLLPRLLSGQIVVSENAQ